MTHPDDPGGGWQADTPGSSEALEFLLAAANDPGVLPEEFADIVSQMWNARTLPNGLAHILSLTDADFLRDHLRSLKADPGPSMPAAISPVSTIKAVDCDEDAESEDCDDECSSHMPGMTPGPEDDAWTEQLAALSDEQMSRLADGLRELLQQAKAREAAEKAASSSSAGDERSIEAIRDRMGL